MLKHYFAQFFRSLKRNKLFSAINILGLSAGICTSMLIYLYVDYQTSFDNFHENGDNIFRVNQTFIWSDQVDEQFGSTGPGVMFSVTEELPEIKQGTRLLKLGYLVSHQNEQGQKQSFQEPNIVAVDSNFFDMFSFQIIRGNEKDLLTNPKNILITETISSKYFGDQNPMGKVLELEFANKKTSYQVAGLIADPPKNTSIEFDMLLPMNSVENVKKYNWSWFWTGFVTYVELYPETNLAHVREKLQEIPPKHAGNTLQRIMNMSFEEYTKDGKKWEIFLQPLSDIHLNTNVLNRISSPVNISTVYAYAMAAFFIILLSCINFTNLTTTQHIKRAKFSGIKKLLGSTRWQLSLGYIAESIIYCLISAIFGLSLLWYTIPYFGDLTETPLSVGHLFNIKVYGLLAVLILFMGLIAGGYPALFLSVFKPIDAIKGKLKSGKESAPLRNGLVIIQFAVSVVLISSTLIAFEQLSFTNAKDVGFDRDNVAAIENLEWMSASERESFVNELATIPGIKTSSIGTSVPPNHWAGDQFEPLNAPTETLPMDYTLADDQYLNSLGIELLYGRDFNDNFTQDSSSVILNEHAIRTIGWNLNESVLGKKITYNKGTKVYTIIGVIKDFHYRGLRGTIDAYALFSMNSGMHDSGKMNAIFSLETESSKEAVAIIEHIETKWKAFIQDKPFEFFFVDEVFAANFQAEQNFMKVLSVFTGLAILIASLGLLGIIIYTIEQRTKEIGIRKIVGANVWQIAVLISKQHAKLIFTSILLSIPLTWYMMQQWLEDFQYRITISPFVFVISGIVILGLTLAISGFHSVKAGFSNPVDAIKDE